MANGYLKDGEKRNLVSIEWLRTGRHNGKFYKSYPTSTMGKLIQETDKAYLIACQNANFEKFGYQNEIWIPKTDIKITVIPEFTEEEKSNQLLETMKAKGWI